VLELRKPDANDFGLAPSSEPFRGRVVDDPELIRQLEDRSN